MPPNHAHQLPPCGPVPVPVPQPATVHRMVPKVAEVSSHAALGEPPSKPPSMMTSAIGTALKSRGTLLPFRNDGMRLALPPAVGAASSIVHVSVPAPTLLIVRFCVVVELAACEAARLAGLTSISGSVPPPVHSAMAALTAVSALISPQPVAWFGMLPGPSDGLPVATGMRVAVAMMMVPVVA